MNIIRVLFNCLLITFLLFPTGAAAQPARNAAGTEILVTSQADDVTVNGNCTLREAIRAANLNQGVDACPAGSGADVITLPEGRYYLTIEGSGEKEGLTGDLDIQDDVSLQGAGMQKTIIDGEMPDRILDIHGGDTSVSIHSLTIQDGFLANGPNSEDSEEIETAGKGGAIYNRGTLTVDRVRFYHNTADQTVSGDGTVFNAGDLTIRDSIFDKNFAHDEGAGISGTGVFLIDGVTFSSNLAVGNAVLMMYSGASGTVQNSVFASNICGTAGSGVIAVDPQAELVIESSVIENNDCDRKTIANNGALTLDSVIIQNHGAFEGVIYQQQGTLTILHSWLRNNSTGEEAGQLTILGGEVHVEQTTISSKDGGFLYQSAGTLVVENSTFTHNFSPAFFQSGGMSSIALLGGNTTLDSVTIAGYQGDTPMLAVRGGTLAMHNSILFSEPKLAGEQPVSDCEITAPGQVTSLGYNLIGKNGCQWPSSSGDLLGTIAAPLDPMLEHLNDNGGFAFTRVPMHGSPVIDGGDPQLFLAEDQRGVNRPQGDRADIGAVEAPLPLPVREHLVFLPLIKSASP